MEWFWEGWNWITGASLASPAWDIIMGTIAVFFFFLCFSIWITWVIIKFIIKSFSESWHDGAKK
jgi:hypothetical protein